MVMDLAVCLGILVEQNGWTQQAGCAGKEPFLIGPQVSCPTAK